MAKVNNVAVAGAGIAGLATAISLARRGFEVSVFEQAAQIEEVGAGLQIGPNAANALEMLDAWQAVQPITNAPAGIIIRDGRTGNTLSNVPLGSQFEARFKKPYRVALRADLLGALLEVVQNLRNITIHTDAPVTGYDDTNQPALTFQDRPPLPADILIGADGIRSAIRQQMTPDRPIRDSGHTICRALVPATKAPASADLENVTLWLCAKGHVVAYALPGNRLNVVAVYETAESSTGWSTEVSSGEPVNHFGNCCPDLTSLLAGIDGWWKWAGCDLAPSSQSCAGNITLVGDAAHATLPYLAQGAAMALEDAATLGEVLVPGAQGLEHSLRKFEANRRTRTNRIITQSRKAGQTYHLDGLAAHVRNMVLRALPAAAMHSRLAWIYDWP